MAFIFLNHLTPTISPALSEPNGESTAVRLQLSITSSPGLGLDVEADKVTVNEAIGPKNRHKNKIQKVSYYNTILRAVIFH